MANAKKATKAVKKAPGKSMVKWDEELARRAAIARGTVDSVASGAKQVSLKGGIMTIDGAAVPGNKINVVVLDHCLENTLRDGQYDAEGDNTPICFALGRNGNEMAPHEKSQEPQHDQCKGCPWDKYGSADTGKGKACKNRNRLIILAENDLDDIPSAEYRVLSVPVMSGKAWNGYVRQVDDTFEKPPIAVVTEISVVPDAKSQFKLQFKMVEELSDEYFEELFAKADSAEEDLFRPFEPRSDDEQDDGPVQRRNAGKGKAQRGPQRSARGAQPPAQRRGAAVVPARGKRQQVQEEEQEEEAPLPVRRKGQGRAPAAPAKKAALPVRQKGGGKEAPVKGKRKF